MRQPIQVLVLLYRRKVDGVEYLLLRRADLDCWQGVAGGVDHLETPLEAALRESCEETGTNSTSLIKLQSSCTIPVEFVTGFLWGESIILVDEVAFGLEVAVNFDVILSEEHSEFVWVEYDDAFKKLKWDSNRNALWELNHRLTFRPDYV